MALTLGIPVETAAREKRVACVPAVAARFQALGCEVRVQRGAGVAAGIPDAAFQGVTFVDDAAAAHACDLVLRVAPPSAAELALLKPGTVLISFLAPHADDARVKALRDGKVTAFAMELVPRISRAQSMDALSSQAAVAGYEAVLIAALNLRRFFPMLTTAAGTIRPAKALVVGAGVAGLQAIATARRMGAMVEAFDVRAATKEQVESLGAKFIDTGVKAEGAGGYARELTDAEKAQQLEVLGKHAAGVDCIITTAAIPGRPAPKLITRAMVDAMKPGSVIVDLAAETGGNCELTKPGETVVHGPATIVGPLNLPSLLAEHASEMYAKNLLNLATPFLKGGAIAIDWTDDVLKGAVLTHDGAIQHGPTRQRVEGST
jgi:NAD(P) transhydrogenase subunit alpha